MREVQLKPAPSSSRSLPPLRPDTSDRGRPKTRATDPDSHARTHKNANSISLPPIRPAVRGSRDEEHGPLPGISAIILQADANASKHFDPPVPRRSSETSQRVYYHSPTRDQNSGHHAGSSSQNQSTITQHRRSQDSINTLGADGSLSRPSSPEAPSALSSSFASIKTASSLSSILEDRSACGSPPPILPSFAHIDGHPSGTLPPIGGGHVSPRSSVFELSDLRTHLPVDDLTVRVRPTPRLRAALDSPKSTPLPLSRPMSPAGHAGSPSFSGSSSSSRFNFKPATVDREGHAPHHKKAPSHDKISTNKKSLFVNEVPLNIKAPSHKRDDDTHDHGHHGHKHDQPATGGGSPVLSPIKVEFDPIECPASPTSRGSKGSSHFFDAKYSRTTDGTIHDRPRTLHVNTSDYDQDDTMSSCTPTQTISHSSQFTTREQSPLSGIESSPVTATASAPHTPVMRGDSPLMEPSPLTATTSSSGTSSHTDTGLLSPRPTITSDSEDEDTKPIIAKPSEGEGDKPVGAGARYADRRAKRRGDAGAIDASSVQTRGGFDFGPSGYPGYMMGPNMGMGMGMGMNMGMGGMGNMGNMGNMGPMSGMNSMNGINVNGMNSMNGMNDMGPMGGMGPMGIGMGMGPMGMAAGLGMGTGMGQTPSITPMHNQASMHPASQLDILQMHHAQQMGLMFRPTSDQGWSPRSSMPPMPMSGRGPTHHLIRQHLLKQQMAQREQEIQKLKQEQEQALAELHGNTSWVQDIPNQNVEPVLSERMQPGLSNMFSQLQSIPQDDMVYVQQPQPQSQAQAQPQLPHDTTFDISYTNDPVPAYNDLPDFNTDMHTGLVPPVNMSAPLDDPLIAPLTPGLHRMSQQQQHQQTPQPQQQSTPATTPTASSHALFKSPAEEAAGKDDAAGNGSSSASGSGAHKCEVCGKKFRRPSGLKDHKNIHSGDKPYCCPLETCRKGFATRSNMIRHHNKTHPSRAKIGGVADIAGEQDDYDIGEHEPSPAASSGSGGGTSSQNRFRVVQQTAGMMDGGVGPARGNKDRRAIRKGYATAVVG